MSKRKELSDLSVRQKRRRRRQHHADDLDEESDRHSDCILDKSICFNSTIPDSGDNQICMTLGTQMILKEIDDSNNSPGSCSSHVSGVPVGVGQEKDDNTPTLCDIPSQLWLGTTTNENQIVANDHATQTECSSSELTQPMDTVDTINKLVQTTDGDKKLSLSEELARWAIQCYVPHVSLNLLLKLLRRTGHESLPADARTILNTPRDSTINDYTHGTYVHYGLENALIYQLCNNGFTSLDSAIIIDINIDGLPLSKSSQSSLWPILGKIVGTGFHTPFMIGAYHYHTKPSSVHELLGPFLEEYKRLRTDGFTYESKRYITSIRAVICDSPARCFVSCTKQYNGYFGCPKCVTKGTYLRFVTFLELDAALRTDKDFKDKLQKEHHTGTSPFEDATLKMVSQFPLDYMHVILLGVVKKLLLMWLTGKGILGASARTRLSKSLISLRSWIPREFNRKTRGVEEVRMWKATEFRLFLLYTGSSVLHDLLPDSHLRHFNALSCAIRILCDPEDCIRNNGTAKDLLVWFVRRVIGLYGAEEVVSNVHNLIHINEDVKLYGPLDSFSAFPFENFMQSLKKLLRSPVNPLQQLHRRLTEMMHHVKKFEVGEEMPVLLKEIKGDLPNKCHRPHTAVRLSRFYLSIKQPDNCCFTKAGDIVVVEHIGYRDDEPVILGRRFKQLSGMPLYPIDSRLIDMYTRRVGF